jgi:hypothetical protein
MATVPSELRDNRALQNTFRQPRGVSQQGLEIEGISGGGEMSTVTYLYPNGGKAPTQAQMASKHSAVHATVAFAGEDGPVDIVHNFQFDLEKPPDELQLPLVIVNAVSGGPHAPIHALAVKDGNTLTIGKLGTGPGSEVTYDIWIFRHSRPSFFG